MIVKRLLIKSIFLLLSGIAAAQTAKKTIIPAANLSKSSIMNALYHNYNAKENSSSWLCSDKNVLKAFSLKKSTQYTVKLLYADSVGGKSLYVLLSLNPIDNDCHACAPVLKSLKFTRQSTAWILANEIITSPIGSMGIAPPFNSMKFGNNIGFLFKGGYTNMGQVSSFIELYTWYNNSFKPVLTLNNSSYDNGGDCIPTSKYECYGYEGKIKFLNTNKEFNDILFTKNGTNLINGKVVKIDSAITYKFANGNYIKQ